MKFYLRCRRFADIIIAILATIALYRAPNSLHVFAVLRGQDLQNFALCLIGAAASLLGFSLAASTFLISHLQQPKFDIVRNAKSYHQLSEIISSNLWRLFFTTIAGGALAFARGDFIYWCAIIVTLVIIWTSLAVATSLWLVVRISSIRTDN